MSDRVPPGTDDVLDAVDVGIEAEEDVTPEGSMPVAIEVEDPEVSDLKLGTGKDVTVVLQNA